MTKQSVFELDIFECSRCFLASAYNYCTMWRLNVQETLASHWPKISTECFMVIVREFNLAYFCSYVMTYVMLKQFPMYNLGYMGQHNHYVCLPLQMYVQW